MLDPDVELQRQRHLDVLEECRKKLQVQGNTSIRKLVSGNPSDSPRPVSIQWKEVDWSGSPQKSSGHDIIRPDFTDSENALLNSDSAPREFPSLLTTLRKAVLGKERKPSLLDFMASRTSSPAASRQGSCSQLDVLRRGDSMHSAQLDILKRFLSQENSSESENADLQFTVVCQEHEHGSFDRKANTEPDLLSEIRGTFFRATFRPPCIQDTQIEASRFVLQMGKWVQYFLLVVCLVLQISQESFTFGFVEHRANFTVLRCSVAALLIPFLMFTLQHTSLRLHHTVLCLVGGSWSFKALFHYTLQDMNGWVLVMWELLPVLTTAVTAARISILKRSLEVRASKLVQEDQSLYDQVWKQVTADAKDLAALTQLRKQLSFFENLFVEHCLPPTRTGSCHWSTGPRAAFPSISSLQHAEAVKVKSIDQLHQQSMLVQTLLRGKVQEWALKCRGWFRLAAMPEDAEDGCSFVRWDTISKLPTAGRSVAWATTKSFQRSAQKAVEVYGSDVARVCDVTRETIFFDAVEDVLQCWAAVSGDPCVRVVGAKNAMKDLAAGSSSRTGGFRFVKLQVCVATAQAQQLGLQWHVCELLLVLKTMEKCKRSISLAHERYKEWRKEMVVVRNSASTFMKRVTSLGWEVMHAAHTSKNLKTIIGGPTWTRTASAPEPGPASARAGGAEGTNLNLDVKSADSEDSGSEVSPRRMAVEARRAMLLECVEVMKGYLRSTNTGHYGVIGKRAERVADATVNTNNASSFRMKQPIASALSRPWFQLLLLTAGMLMTGLNAASSLTLLTPSLAHGRTFRFTNLAARDHPNPSWLGVEGFTLTNRARPVDARVEWSVVEENCMTVRYDREVPFDGWSVRTVASPQSVPEYDAVSFKLETHRRGEGEGTWETVGASAWFKEVGWPRVFLPEQRFDTPLLRGSEVPFPLHDVWHAILIPAGGLVVGCTMCSAAACGYLEKPMLGVGIIKVMVMVAALIHLLATVLLRLENQWQEAMLVASWSVSSFVWVTLVHCWPPMLLEAFMAAGTMNCIAAWVVRTNIHNVHLLQRLDPVGVMYILIGVYCKTLVLFNDWRGAKAHRRDFELYKHAWEVMSCEDAGNGVLDKLKDFTDGMQTDLNLSNVFQCTIPYPPAMDKEPDSLDPLWWSRCTISDSDSCVLLCPRATSIDQLYGQAEVAAVFLRHKVMRWAAASHGYLQTAKTKQWVPATELAPPGTAQPGERFNGRPGTSTNLKQPARALEKMFRCYGGDPSQLLDLSRHAIAFERPGQLLACLKLLGDDPDVRVVRVKNDLHSSQDSASGYRQVLINLRVVCPDTERMGASMHVSEVQLLGLGFALVKTEQGHRHYVDGRNARGE